MRTPPLPPVLPRGDRVWYTRFLSGLGKPDVLYPRIVRMRGSYHFGLMATVMHDMITLPASCLMPPGA